MHLLHQAFIEHNSTGTLPVHIVCIDNWQHMVTQSVSSTSSVLLCLADGFGFGGGCSVADLVARGILCLMHLV
jgi:hypothetical protein